MNKLLTLDVLSSTLLVFQRIYTVYCHSIHFFSGKKISLINSLVKWGVYCDSIQYIHAKYHNVYTVTVCTFFLLKN